MLVDGRGYHHARDAAQVGQVKQAVVRHAVLADDASAVDAEGHRQSLDGHIVDDGVIAALQEGAVDGAVRVHAVLGQTTGKRHRVALADAHVKRARGHGLKHHRHRRATGHGSGDADNFVIFLSQLDKCLAEHVLVLDGTALAALGAFTGLLVKFAGGVPCGGVGLGSSKAFSLDGAHVHQFGAGHVLDFPEDFDQALHVVPVVQAEVADVQALEDVLLTREQRLQRVAEAHDQSPAVIVDDVVTAQELIGLVAQLVVAVRRVQVAHVATQRTHVGINRHVIVVEHDNQVIRIGRGIVDALKGQSAADAGVTDDGNHLAAGVMLQLGGNRHSQRCRDGIRGMACSERVILALGGIGKTAQAVQLAVVVKLVATTGQYLVGIGLMAHVPHQAVVGRVEHVVQRHDDFHGAHTRGEVAGVA